MDSNTRGRLLAAAAYMRPDYATYGPSMLNEANQAHDHAWFSLRYLTLTGAIYRQIRRGEALTDAWEDLAPAHPAAFTTDAAGRLTLVTRPALDV